MKSIFAKILHGFLFGVGLILSSMLYMNFAMSMFFSAPDKMVINESDNVTITELTESMSSFDPFSFDPSSIEITKHREVERGERLVFLGEIKNVAEKELQHASITVDLYLGDEFVKQCETYVRGSLETGEMRNFEISCGGGCSSNPIVEHDSYKIYITGM